jgi:hypothetical protein
VDQGKNTERARSEIGERSTKILIRTFARLEFTVNSERARNQSLKKFPKNIFKRALDYFAVSSGFPLEDFTAFATW